MDAPLRDALDKLALRFREMEAARQKLNAVIREGRSSPQAEADLAERLDNAEGLMWVAASMLTWRWELDRADEKRARHE